MHVFYIVNVHELCVCQIRWNNRTSINVHQISKCPVRQVLDYISLIKGVCAIGNGSWLYNVWTHTHKNYKRYEIHLLHWVSNITKNELFVREKYSLYNIKLHLTALWNCIFIEICSKCDNCLDICLIKFQYCTNIIMQHLFRTSTRDEPELM